MANAPALLDDDGSASVATAVLMSHHGLRRDIARFACALENVARGDVSKVDPLREQWQSYRDTLHGHHDAEDTRVFPSLLGEQPTLAAIIAELTADHRRIDPLLERGDRAFAELPNASAAAAVVMEIAALLDDHLAKEEASVLPFLRGVREFPPPQNEQEIALYAQGFGWSSHGVAPEVLEQVDKLLPESLRARLPAARAEFAAKSERVWGPLPERAARTSVPER